MSESQSKEPGSPSQLQADAIQALLSNSSKGQRPKQRSASSFGEQAELADESDTNKHSLLCPKEGCGSLILKPGIAVLTPNKQAPLDPPGHPAPAPLPTHDPDNPSSWWLVSGSPMLFENIGFSKTLDPDSDGVRRKLLACAECDIGPLGWCVLGGTEHWIAVDRVGYQLDE